MTALMNCMRLQREDVWVTLCYLDDMKIYGQDVWIGYADVCKHDAWDFILRVKHRNGLKEAIEQVKGAKHESKSSRPK